jgi:hypothetical protein
MKFSLIRRQVKKSYTITFEGGFGGQLSSACAYFYLESQDFNVGADMSYFSPENRDCILYNEGGCTVWKYELSNYNLPITYFKSRVPNSEIVNDCAKKLLLAELGFNSKEIRSKFMINTDAYKYKETVLSNDDFICLHVRRGDYLNVASYIIADERYFNITKKITEENKLISKLLVVSDTPISENLRNLLNTLDINVIYNTETNTHVTHGLMRLSTILICSNSQLSMTAGFLRHTDAVTYFPTDYIGNNHEIDIQVRKFKIFKFY